MRGTAWHVRLHILELCRSGRSRRMLFDKVRAHGYAWPDGALDSQIATLLDDGYLALDPLSATRFRTTTSGLTYLRVQRALDAPRR